MPEHSIYDRTILDLAGNIPRLGRLPTPDGSATVHSRMCGSTVTTDVAVGDAGQVADYAHEVHACALGQASAAIVAAAAIGAERDEIDAARTSVRAMLKDDAEPPEGRFSGFAALASARAYPARHPAILLSFDALLNALDDAEARSGDPARARKARAV